jgi:hypothetical protein
MVIAEKVNRCGECSKPLSQPSEGIIFCPVPGPQLREPLHKSSPNRKVNVCISREVMIVSLLTIGLLEARQPSGFVQKTI